MERNIDKIKRLETDIKRRDMKIGRQADELRKAKQAVVDAEMNLSGMSRALDVLLINIVLSLGEANEDGSIELTMPKPDTAETEKYAIRTTSDGERYKMTVTERPQMTDLPENSNAEPILDAEVTRDIPEDEKADTGENKGKYENA